MSLGRLRRAHIDNDDGDACAYPNHLDTGRGRRTLHKSKLPKKSHGADFVGKRDFILPGCSFA
jgi:hypothetical protein